MKAEWYSGTVWTLILLVSKNLEKASPRKFVPTGDWIRDRWVRSASITLRPQQWTYFFSPFYYLFELLLVSFSCLSAQMRKQTHYSQIYGNEIENCNFAGIRLSKVVRAYLPFIREIKAQVTKTSVYSLPIQVHVTLRKIQLFLKGTSNERTAFFLFLKFQTNLTGSWDLKLQYHHTLIQ